MYYRAGSLYRADGTRIGRLADGPITPSQATKVYDASTTGVGAWVHDIAVDSTGRPVITFATFPSRDDHRYQYARWTGTRWMTKELTRAGGSISTDPVEYQYSGGITLDHDNPSVVYLSRRINGVHEIERWATADGGATWTRTAITARSTQPNVRPVSPWGLPNDGPMNVVWMAGNYGTYTTFQTRIMRTGGNPENQAPTARYTASPRTGVAPLTVAFDGRRSTDPEGPVVAWTWDFGDGTAGSGPTVSHTYTRPGTYPVALRVTDAHTPNPGNDVLVKEVVVTG